ncbi:ATP synthase complex subunit H-domain-containing protein [Xylaria castorea]|nr:ATP synthase complex subunit H-domain-containing protein [Xylaria castorea]
MLTPLRPSVSLFRVFYGRESASEADEDYSVPNMDYLTFSQTARLALSAVTRVARVNTVRGFIAPTVSRRADFVQELYLKELKAYKPTPIKESDSVGQVQTFSAPKTPKSPEEADLATSLKEYESMAVEVEGNEGVTASTPAVVEDWLVEEEEEEKGGAHH